MSSSSASASSVRYCKSRWEYGEVPFPTFLDRVVSDGFDGIDFFLFPERDADDALREEIKKRRLHFIGQVICLGDDAEAHRTSLDSQVARAVACGAASINCHTGSDFFTFEENLGLFRQASDLAQRHGLPIRHETHRGRALYNLPDTVRYLAAHPELELTADLSHFLCVHESELHGREKLLDQVIARTRHIHARVGFSQGPQVGHPLAPENAGLLERHLAWWYRMAEVVLASGAPFVTVTPEAGPPPYMPVTPFANTPVADAWTVNVEMKDWLKSRLKPTWSRLKR